MGYRIGDYENIGHVMGGLKDELEQQEN